MNSFDIDGVVFMKPGLMGVRPGPEDIIITGRSVDEIPETIEMLDAVGIHNTVFFNPIPYDQKTRESSGAHKAEVLNRFGPDYVKIHFEDDPIQVEVIRERCPWITVVHLDHDLTNKENVRHTQW
jgi:hypothetical protein